MWFSFHQADNDEPLHVNMRNNDRGTDDPDTIASWIYMCDYVVYFIPFIGQSVATERPTFGGLKAYFR